MNRAIGQAMELCAGMGGIGIGLRTLGFEVTHAFDSWDSAVAIYNHNVGANVAEVCNLLSKAGLDRVTAAKKEIGELDLLAAGPPCKGFSQLRNGFHDGHNPHNRVLAAMPDYVALLRPRMFVIENVPDLLRHSEGRTFSTLLQNLERPARGLKYSLAYRIYDAAWFGTPQARRRVLIWGTRAGGYLKGLPEPGPDLTPLYAAVRRGGVVPQSLRRYLDVLADADDRRLTTAEQALSDLPLLPAGALDNELRYRSKPISAFQRWVRQKASSLVRDVRTPNVTAVTAARLGHISPGGCARTIPAEHLNGLARRYDSAYRRLHPKAPSTALSTKYDCVYHYARPRSLSVREYARLQGIPDQFTFPTELACRRLAYEMIGNSVPPPLIEGVLGSVLEVAP